MARVEINQGELNRLLHSRSGPVGTFVSTFGKSVERRAKKHALKDRGDMRRAINASGVNYSPTGLSLVVSSPDHASMVIHQGHGVIKPVSKPYMKFQPKDLRGTKKFVRTIRVRAVGGYPFLTAALVEANEALPLGTKFRIVIRVQPRRGSQPSGAPRLNYPS